MAGGFGPIMINPKQIIEQAELILNDGREVQTNLTGESKAIITALCAELEPQRLMSGQTDLALDIDSIIREFHRKTMSWRECIDAIETIVGAHLTEG